MRNISKEGDCISVLSMDIKPTIWFNTYIENDVLKRDIYLSNNYSI